MKRVIIVSTSYGALEIVNLKRVWVNSFFGCSLMYSDDKFEYNCIYYSNTIKKKSYYQELKNKLLNAYNNGERIIEL